MELARAKVAQEAIEARREADRDRQNRRRNVMSRDNVDVTDATPSLSLPPDPQPNPTPARDISIPRAKCPFPMPEGVNPDHWRDFLANRKRKNLSNTPTAHKRLMDDLFRWSDDEWPPPRLIEHAAARGWAGIYDPREEQTNVRQQRQSGPRPHRPDIGRTMSAGANVLARYQANG